MFVLPVIDLMQGLVVHGRAGERERYQPIRSSLAADAQPSRVAQAFAHQLGMRRAYVADLDAIAGAEPDWRSYEQIAEFLPELWIDAGVSQAVQALQLATWQSSRFDIYPICALETLSAPESLREMLDRLGPQRLVVSLDLFHGRVRSQVGAWHSGSPALVAGELIRLGVRRMIVLDVAHVGMDEGTGTRPVVRDIWRLHPEVEIICGGGISSVDQLKRLADDGCSAALVATALHDGRLGRADVGLES